MTFYYTNFKEFSRRENKQWNGTDDPAKVVAAPETNVACWNISDCENCKDCTDCRRCNSCTDCENCEDLTGGRAVRNFNHKQTNK